MRNSNNVHGNEEDKEKKKGKSWKSLCKLGLRQSFNQSDK